MLSFEVLVPDLRGKGISLNKMKVDWVDTKLRRGPDNRVNLIIFEEEGDDFLADAAIGSNHKHVLSFVHVPTGNKIFY